MCANDNLAEWRESAARRGHTDAWLPYWAERVRVFDIGPWSGAFRHHGMIELWATGWPWRALYIEGTDIGQTGYPSMRFSGFVQLGETPFLDRVPDPWTGRG